MRLIAHRGGAGLRVENTLAAFENAIDLGAAGAELDVHLSHDGQVVVHHNARLNGDYTRNADGDWIDAEEERPLAALSHADMQRFTIGAPRPGTRYARSFEHIEPVSGQRIPLLRQVIRLAKQRSRHFVLVVEIKTSMLEAADRPWKRLVEATLEVIDQEDFSGRTVLCSFDWGALVYARERRPDMATWFTSAPMSWMADASPPVADIPPSASHLRSLRALYNAGNTPWFGGFDPRDFVDGYAQAIAAAGGDAWFPYYRDCSEGAARECRRHGLRLAAWSVNLRDRQEIRRLARIGVDDVVMDYPDIDVH